VRKASADLGSAQNSTEVAMNWWGWVILALVIAVVLAAVAAVVQRKRRRGGVIGLNDPGRSDSR
jgi:anti-sigma-K factor RskA